MPETDPPRRPDETAAASVIPYGGFRPGPRRLLSDGLWAGLVALSLLWAIGRLAPALPFPPFALTQRLIQLTPGDVATLSIERLGHLGMPLFIGGVSIAVLVVAASIPLLLARIGRGGAGRCGAAFALLIAMCLLVSTTGVELPVVLVLGAAGGLTFAAALGLLRSVPRTTGYEADPQQAEPNPVDQPFIKWPPEGLSRRGVVAGLGGGTLLLVFGGTLLGKLLGVGRQSAVAIAPAAPAAVATRGAFPEIPGLAPEVTPVADHYVVDINVVNPAVDVSTWRLKVSGLVDSPFEIDFNALQSEFPVVEEYSVLTCISNEVGGPLIGNTAWRGVRLKDLLERAAPAAGATAVRFTCADGYDNAVPLERALDEANLVAFGQGGKALTRDHGAPVRIRIPSLYGMLQAKWVTGIELLAELPEWYWSKRGWSKTGVIQTQSRIDVIEPERAGQKGRIAGVAWAGERGISEVEVSTDDQKTWQKATVRKPMAPLSWSQWYVDWMPERAGIYQLACRARDGEGAQQDALRRPPHPSGATGYHVLARTVS